MNEADLAAAVYDVVLDSSFQATYAVDTEDPNTIDLSVSGGFSVYSAIDGLRKLYNGNDLHYELFVGGNVVELQTNTITNGKGTLGYQKNNLSPDSAAATAMLVIYRGTDTSNVVATKNITISMHPHVLFDDSNGLLVKINNNKKSITTIKSDGDSLSATVKDIGDGLKDTGIDIKKNTIDLRAGQVSFLGANGNPYIKAELDDEGMPHLIFYNKAGTAMYDLGYTGLFNLIQDSQEQKWVEYSGVLGKGATISCKNLVPGYAKLSGTWSQLLLPEITIYEYHSAYFMSGNEKKYYHQEDNYLLYKSNSVDSSKNNEPTGGKVFETNGVPQGFLYEPYGTPSHTESTIDGTTIFNDTWTYYAHDIALDKFVNYSSGGIKVVVQQTTIFIDDNEPQYEYKWRVGSGDWQDGDTVTTIE